MENTKVEEVLETVEETKEESVVTEEVVKEVIVEKVVEVEVEKIVEVPVEVIKEVAVQVAGTVNFNNKSEVAKALAGFNTEMENIAKNAKNPFFKSSYLDLSAISNTVRPLLAKNGLSIIQYPIDDENGRISVNTVLLHESGQSIEFPGIWVKPSKIGDIQILGSVITYLKRYSVAAILFVSGCDEDDDGEQAVGRGETTQAEKPATQTRGTSLRSSRL